ncbi:hypothetical protein Q8A73_015392 [Channa argus]|nr:hypothetical protein Q8A73_015392 [Channa argus]
MGKLCEKQVRNKAEGDCFAQSAVSFGAAVMEMLGAVTRKKSCVRHSEPVNTVPSSQQKPRCKCNLHANSCVFDKGKLGCECEHNTTGSDCSRCKRHYHGRAWSVGSYLPIPKGTANISQKRNHFKNYVHSPLCRDHQLILCSIASSQVKRRWAETLIRIVVVLPTVVVTAPNW